MKRITIISFAVLSLTGAFVACSGRHANEIVSIEKTGTYHREGCPPVNMANTKVITVAEAKADHLKPCPVCKPDTL